MDETSRVKPFNQRLQDFASSLMLLNDAQLRAVKHDPNTSLQILAGPGSGKTRVLTSRIAYLILHHNLPPSSICAVTFTNKAALEMRERLTKLIGKQLLEQVRMGTFHSLCALFLRKYAHVLGLKSNFSVCDGSESKKTIGKLVKLYQQDNPSRNILKENIIASTISKAKLMGLTASDFGAYIVKPRTVKKAISKNGEQTTPFGLVGESMQVVADVYEGYEEALKKCNSFDFDDLLLYGLKLFSQHEQAVSWCRHVLVDEFQDTSIIQYELMKSLAISGCVTIVGDPDQSIYGWRSAETENLGRMQKCFPSTEQIFLEENYRSTNAIVRTSLTIVDQDKARIQKTLRTSHPIGFVPVLRSFRSESEEAAFIATEIKRVVANMGGVLNYRDFAILLRTTSLSRAIESALQKEGIPNRVLGGHKFFESLEIKDLLAYLQLVDNPFFAPAFTRAVNVPTRGIGQKTLSNIASRAEKTGMSHFEVIEGIYDGHAPDVKPPVKQKLQSFVKTLRTLRSSAQKGMLPSNLIRELIDLIEYREHLKKTVHDTESRWENIQELISFASEVETGWAESVDSISVKDDSASNEWETPLRTFLQASMLSSEGDSQKSANEKVTISTCHAAKGLEWPIVMLPAVEQGILPSYRADDVEEERRLLYVACTRAQAILYLCHVEKRTVAGETKHKEPSEFISDVVRKHPEVFSQTLPIFTVSNRSVISKVLNRPLPDEEEVLRSVAEFEKRRKNLERSTGIMFSTELSTTDRNGLETIPSASYQSINTTFTRPSNPQVLIAHSNINTNVLVSDSINPAAQSNHTLAHLAMPLTNQNNIDIAVSTQADLPTTMVLGDSAGVKRRLGMGRSTAGYTNKKFKRPT